MIDLNTGPQFQKCFLGSTSGGQWSKQPHWEQLAWFVWNRVLNIKVPPQNISSGAKRAAAAAAIVASDETAEAAPEFKHKWQADIAAAVGGGDMAKKDFKPK